MIWTVVNAVFAAICLYTVRFAWLRVRLFLWVGWTRMDSAVRQGDYRTNVESRRAVNEAGSLLFAGVIWLVTTIGAAVGAMYFTWNALGF